jgi:cell division septum initiation protein DivIVA
MEQVRAEAEALHGDAAREARRIVEDAQQQAAAIVGEAKAVAARVRADSERELAAATQRRDSINAQLANVRQMLATLTGSSAIPLVEDAFADQREQGRGETRAAEADAPDDEDARPDDEDAAEEARLEHARQNASR